MFAYVRSREKRTHAIPWTSEFIDNASRAKPYRWVPTLGLKSVNSTGFEP